MKAEAAPSPAGLPASIRRRGLRRLLLAVAVALVVPKCVLCVAAYAALAMGLAGAGSELCGASPTDGLPGLGWADLWLVGTAAAALAAAHVVPCARARPKRGSELS